jgi:hypothetical protein
VPLARCSKTAAASDWHTPGLSPRTGWFIADLSLIISLCCGRHDGQVRVQTEMLTVKAVGGSRMADIFIDDSIPKMDASSAVYPTARLIGDSLIVAYHLPGCETCAVIRFNEVIDWTYGYPNDEGLHEHALWGKGLTFYEFHEVKCPEGGDKRWIGTFHDGTLTVRAKSVDVVDEQRGCAPWAAIEARFGPGVNIVLDQTRDGPRRGGRLQRMLRRLFGKYFRP